MSISTTDLDADLAAIIADYPQAITFSGTSYACACDDLTSGRGPDLAGIFPDEGIAVHIRTALLTTRPVAGNTVTYGAKTLRVVSVVTSVDDNMLTLNCEEVTA